MAEPWWPCYRLASCRATPSSAHRPTNHLGRTKVCPQIGPNFSNTSDRLGTYLGPKPRYKISPWPIARPNFQRRLFLSQPNLHTNYPLKCVRNFSFIRALKKSSKKETMWHSCFIFGGCLMVFLVSLWQLDPSSINCIIWGLNVITKKKGKVQGVKCN